MGAKTSKNNRSAMKLQPTLLETLRQSAAGKLPTNAHLFEAQQKPAKRAKYSNEKVEYMGEAFDSKKEYKRYRELLLLQKHGHIGQLRRQVPYMLIESVWEPINGKRGKPLKIKKCVEKQVVYWADFVYILTDTGAEVVEDSKGVKTLDYIIKRKLMKAIHNIQIKET
jgi:hypothetical protein